MIISASTVKTSASGLIGAFAVLGIVPEDIPNYFAILVGMIIGTATAWARADQDSVDLPARWALWQAAMCAFFAMFVLFLQWMTGVVDGRATGFVSAVLAFLSREALDAIGSRSLTEIKERFKR